MYSIAVNEGFIVEYITIVNEIGMNKLQKSIIFFQYFFSFILYNDSVMIKLSTNPVIVYLGTGKT